ncbi:CopG family antitoxin [Candidatus Margulisiibacteriota bacterium]
MRKPLKLDKEEQILLESFENGEWQSSGNLESRREQLKRYVKHTIKSKKSISLRLPEGDLFEIKKKSLEVDIPYQTLIQILVHRYVQGKIKLGI